MGMVDVARWTAWVSSVTLHDDYIDFALDQVGGQLRYPSVIAVGGTPLDHNIASLGVAGVPKLLAERLRLLAVG